MLIFACFAMRRWAGHDASETDEWKAFSKVVDRWRAQDIDIDYCWVRTISDIDAKLDAWLSGKIVPEDMVWTLWGYHLLTDIVNQMVIDDPAGVITAWQARLTPYPRTLQHAIIRKHMASLNYWRNDYHYRNKVERGDMVFLAGMAARLVHDSCKCSLPLTKHTMWGMGIICIMLITFAIQPRDFAARVSEILYPLQTGNRLTAQYDAIISLIDDVSVLAAQVDAAE